jgi:hypothetical protein
VPDRRAVLAGVGTLWLTAAHGRDTKLRPPELRSFASPSGTFVLEVRGPAGGASLQARAELFSAGAAGRQSLWSKPLPQRYGPGTAVVFDDGRVVLIDEWVKTPSPYALMLLAANGDTLVCHSMADIAAVSGVSTARLVTGATAGPWMSAPPERVAGRKALLVTAGKVRLELDLASGRLAREDSAKP